MLHQGLNLTWTKLLPVKILSQVIPESRKIQATKRKEIFLKLINLRIVVKKCKICDRLTRPNSTGVRGLGGH